MTKHGQRPAPAARDIERNFYAWFLPISTRWADNDIYGHVNNVNYYAYFDTAANHFLINEGGLDIHHGQQIAFVVQSQCNYLQALAYPEPIEAGVRVNRLGRSSVEYGIAIFRAGGENACAYGTFTHVFVDRESQRPVPIEEPLRRALQGIVQADGHGHCE